MSFTSYQLWVEIVVMSYLLFLRGPAPQQPRSGTCLRPGGCGHLVLIQKVVGFVVIICLFPSPPRPPCPPSHRCIVLLISVGSTRPSQLTAGGVGEVTGEEARAGASMEMKGEEMEI